MYSFQFFSGNIKISSLIFSGGRGQLLLPPPPPRSVYNPDKEYECFLVEIKWFLHL